MEKLIDETLQIAKTRFVSFGFEESQTEALLISAKRDLSKVIVQLEDLLKKDSCDIEQINKSLHALKGLLYNMGNMEAGDQIVELSKCMDEEGLKSRIKKIIKS